MAAATSILTALFLFAASLCGGFCDVKTVDLHACCHHKKTPSQADSHCSQATDKVELSVKAVHLHPAPSLVDAPLPLYVAETTPQPSPPLPPPIPITALRI